MLLAGYADADITPPPGEEMTGYGYYLNRRARGTLDPLRARALALSDGDAQAVVVQIDLLGLPEDLVAQVRRDAQEQRGLPAERLMLHCTHTHSGPAAMPLFGCGMPSEYYPRLLRAKLADCIGRALDDLKPAASTRRFEIDFPNGFAHNRVGGTDLDTRVRGLRIECEAAQPIVALSYACHPVVLGRNDEYSADYPGHLINEFNAYGERAVYLNGCCGDVNPKSNAFRFGSGTPDTLRIYGRDLAAAARRGLARSEPWTPGPIRARSRRIPLMMDMPALPALRASLEKRRAELEKNPADHRARVETVWLERMIGLTEAGALQDAMRAEVQAIACGDVAFVALSGETFTRLGRIVRRGAADHLLMIAATSNGLLGYIATPEDYDRRGYASTSACKLYGMPLPAREAGVRWAEEGERLVADACGSAPAGG